MRRLLATLMLLLMTMPAMAGRQKAVPLPPERPFEVAALTYPGVRLAQATNPDPFNTRHLPAQAQPGAPGTPVVVQSSGGEVQGWANTGLLGIIAGLLGWKGFSKTASPGGDEVKRQIEAAALQLIQSGIPGQALQTGLSLIPGAGPIVTQVEPLVRHLVVKVLQEQLGGTVASTSPMPSATSSTLQDMIGGLVKDALAKHLKPA